MDKKEIFKQLVDRTLSYITIPSTIATIGEYAFRDCTNLKQIDIRSNIISIGDSAFVSSGLQNITIPSSVEVMGNSVFYTCTNLTNVVISYGVSMIGDSDFGYCSALIEIDMPNSITNIGNFAFTNCSALTNITIPSSVEVMGNGVFNTCDNLISVIFNQPNSMVVSLPTAGSGTGLFYVKTAKKMTIYTDNETIKNYDYSADNVTPTFYHLDGTAWA